MLRNISSASTASDPEAAPNRMGPMKQFAALAIAVGVVVGIAGCSSPIVAEDMKSALKASADPPVGDVININVYEKDGTTVIGT